MLNQVQHDELFISTRPNLLAANRLALTPPLASQSSAHPRSG